MIQNFTNTKNKKNVPNNYSKLFPRKKCTKMSINILAPTLSTVKWEMKWMNIYPFQMNVIDSLLNALTSAISIFIKLSWSWSLRWNTSVDVIS